MKYRSFAGFFILLPAFLTLLTGCEVERQIRSSYNPVLPSLPGDWTEVLGETRWHMEWIGEEGIWHKWEGKQGDNAPSLFLIQTWTTPVLAWPFWPELGLNPGIMRPCGALFPWDTYGGDLCLTWEGGVDAVFWKEMAAVVRQTGSAHAGLAEDKRLPWFFDWPRFREVMKGEGIGGAVRQDPWVVDWKEVSKKTVESGFDSRRIRAMKFTELEIPSLDLSAGNEGVGSKAHGSPPAGRWLGSSPFAPVLEIPPGKPLTLEVTDAVGVWVSSRGILKASTSGWIFRPW